MATVRYKWLRALATTNIYLPKKAPLALDLRERDRRHSERQAAIAGQSAALTAGDYAAAAGRLRGAARDIAALAEAASVIADPLQDGARTNPQSPL